MTLYLVPTPIGHLKDITLRALETLKEVDYIACEDTRVTAKLLAHFSITRSLLSYHDHNSTTMRPRLLKLLQDGFTIALVSDAGTPLISDPGYKLVQMCHDHDIPVTCLPGASSILPALLLSGFPPYPFVFCGFVSSLQEWISVKATLIFFESPRRVVATLKAMQTKLPGRRVAVARELTKIYEECRRGTYEEVIAHYVQHPPKGEIIIILGPPEKIIWDKNAIDLFIKEHISMKKTELTKEVMQRTGLSREEAYALVHRSLEDKLIGR